MDLGFDYFHLHMKYHRPYEEEEANGNEEKVGEGIGGLDKELIVRRRSQELGGGLDSVLLQRLGHSQENLLVAKVLYRMHLATLIRTKESDLKRVNHSSSRAREIVSEQEAIGMPQLDFSCRIHVLGKSGVGKSATINSIWSSKNHYRRISTSY
ncbi:Translocase of chloroplast 90 [Vigna angularis]|uniref:Translocase of chloroplast 90 n=1 Tax=Phaseolus angularis TaxID=3914 RepID=A0A8T0L0D3_PHAAN|nr:Translocase of chloroplast 90 [Vigna angularis]